MAKVEIIYQVICTGKRSEFIKYEGASLDEAESVFGKEMRSRTKWKEVYIYVPGLPFERHYQPEQIRQLMSQPLTEEQKAKAQEIGAWMGKDMCSRNISMGYRSGFVAGNIPFFGVADLELNAGVSSRNRACEYGVLLSAEWHEIFIKAYSDAYRAHQAQFEQKHEEKVVALAAAPSPLMPSPEQSKEAEEILARCEEKMPEPVDMEERLAQQRQQHLEDRALIGCSGQYVPAEEPEHERSCTCPQCSGDPDDFPPLKALPIFCIECEEPANHHVPVGNEEGLTVALCDRHCVSFSEAQYQISHARLEGDWQVTRPNSDEWAIYQLVGNEWKFAQHVSDLAWFDGWVKQGIYKIRPSEFGDGACGAWRKLGKSEAAILGFNLPPIACVDCGEPATDGDESTPLCLDCAVTGQLCQECHTYLTCDAAWPIESTASHEPDYASWAKQELASF